MTATKKRRVRKGGKDRRGISIMIRKGGGWCASWESPDTGKRVQESLGQYNVTNENGAAAWAKRKSAEVLARKAAIKAGASIYTATAVRAAVDSFLEGQTRLADKTARQYRYGLSFFVRWADGAKVRETGDLTGVSLDRFHAWLGKQEKHAQVKGGSRKTTGDPLSPKTQNTVLMISRKFLNKIRKGGSAPLLSGDSIKDNLPAVKNRTPIREFIRGPDVEKLLRAAMKHDAVAFKATREEHRNGTGGETARHTPIAPFVAAVLLSGARVTEMRELPWAEVDLENGEIIISADRCKTGSGRRIGRDESPALFALLARLRLRGGDAPRVFDLTEQTIKRAQQRLIGQFGAPRFSWQTLRRTSCSYLCSAAGIHGAASVFLSAKRHGHSSAIAERFYANVVKVDPGAATLEAALDVEDVLDEIVETIGGSTVAMKRRA